jgi:hypothetical protein
MSVPRALRPPVLHFKRMPDCIKPRRLQSVTDEPVQDVENSWAAWVRIRPVFDPYLPQARGLGVLLREVKHVSRTTLISNKIVPVLCTVSTGFWRRGKHSFQLGNAVVFASVSLEASFAYLSMPESELVLLLSAG